MKKSELKSTIKQNVFGKEGFSTDLKLDTDELMVIRKLVREQWLSNIQKNFPDKAELFNHIEMDDYHQIEKNIDHKEIWGPKDNRVLKESSVNQIKQMKFFDVLKRNFGKFMLTNVALVGKNAPKREEMYWRIVRPHQDEDVNSLHVDSWFHREFHGKTPDDGDYIHPEESITVKVWIPLYCEPGLNGLLILPASHNRKWNFKKIFLDGKYKPEIDENVGQLPVQLINTLPGNAVVFHEDLLHGGSINRANSTRVSLEFTVLLN